MPRQHVSDQIDGPLLEGLAHKRVIGVRTGGASNFPRLLPRQVSLVHQETHQLRHRQRRMRVVHLDGDPIGKRGEILMLFQIPANHIADRAGDQKVLL